MVVKLIKLDNPKTKDETLFPYEIHLTVGTVHIKQMNIGREEFIDLYRQMTRMMVDEVIENYDPDKPRPGFGSNGEEHKKLNVNIEDLKRGYKLC